MTTPEHGVMRFSYQKKKGSKLTPQPVSGNDSFTCRNREFWCMKQNGSCCILLGVLTWNFALYLWSNGGHWPLANGLYSFGGRDINIGIAINFLLLLSQYFPWEDRTEEIITEETLSRSSPRSRA